MFFKSTSLKLGLLNRKLNVDFKSGLNLENPITNYPVECRPLFHVFIETLYNKKKSIYNMIWRFIVNIMFHAMHSSGCNIY